MKIIGLNDFGGPEVLRRLEVADPHPGAGEVRIRVQAAGVNPADLVLRSGVLEPGESPAPHVPGMDAAGVIDETGPGSRWSVGDRVMGMALPFSTHGGAYAEYLIAPDNSIARVPVGVSIDAAATIPMNGLTATQVIELLSPVPGSTVAVIGATGTLGGYVVQLAKQAGAVVVADGLDEDRELLKKLGADHIVTRGPGVVDRIRKIIPAGVDGLADIATRKDEVLPALADGGVYVSVLYWAGDPQRRIRFTAAAVGKEYLAHEKLDALRVAVESGVLTPRVAAVLPADDADEAHRRLAAGGLRGRIILRF